MKKILEKIFGVGSSVVGDVSEALDRFIRTKEDRDAFEKEMTQIFIRAEAEMQKNVSDRWKYDMESDSWLSKNVRPLVLVFLIFNTMILIFIEGGVISFDVKQEWISLLQIVLLTVISAYFGGRSIEKVNKTRNNKS
jgi:hypothetical protein|tara:strand:+ start:1448 stop:1858 length:411 start_codon:yes stop_codon:yes gene_type:complete